MASVRLVSSRWYGATPLDLHWTKHQTRKAILLNLDIGSGGGPYNWHPRAQICLSYDLPKFKVREDVIHGDAHFLPFRTGCFLVAYGFNVLEHVKNPHLVMREMIRVSQTVLLRQDSVLNIANYATPEHLWFQLPNLRFLQYPRTRMGIFFSKMLRVLLTQSIPSLPHHHQILRLVGFFMPPNQQYQVRL